MKPNNETPVVKPVQGTEQEFAEITAGIQMTMILRMANSFNLPVQDFTETVLDLLDKYDRDIKVTVKTDERGIGELRFDIPEYPPSIWKLGGVYAYRTPETKEQPGLNPLNLVVALNSALLEVRRKVEV